uniref:Uncharacterized protein n=1 Tax=Anguilla anguilla TaxID=7936 RepID=A0A0E9SQ26_ANGAN
MFRYSRLYCLLLGGFRGRSLG